MKTNIYIVGSIVLLLSGFAGSLRGEDAAVESKKAPDTGALIKALKSDAVEPRLRAKATLIRMREKAGPITLKALSGTSPDESYDLIEILSIIRYRPAAGDIEKIWQATEDTKVKLMASQALCRFDYKYDRYQSYILNRTSTGDDSERLEAMQMLGYIGDKRVVDPLVKIFNDPKRSDQIRQAAIWDLGHTPVKESAEALVNLVDDAKVDWFYKEIIIASIKTLATDKEMAPLISALLAKVQNIPVPATKGK
jgi:HEAT repeat protein